MGDDYNYDEDRQHYGEGKDTGGDLINEHTLKIAGVISLAAVVVYVAFGVAITQSKGKAANHHKMSTAAILMNIGSSDPTSLSSYRSSKPKRVRTPQYCDAYPGRPGQWMVVRPPDCAPGMSCAKFVPDDEMEAYKRELSTKQVYTKKGAKTWLGTGRPPWAD